MRILLAQNSLYYPAHGGGDKSNRLLLEALAARGHVCRAVARLSAFGAAEHACYLKDLRMRGVTPDASDAGVVTFSRKGVDVRVVTDANLRAYFAAQVDAFHPEIILNSTDDPAQTLLEVALQASSARVVYLARATLAVLFGPDCAFPSEAKTAVLRRVDLVVGVSRYVAEYFQRWAGIPAVHVPISLMEETDWPLLGRFENEFVTLVNPCAVKGISIFLALADAMPDVSFAAVPTWGTNEQDRAALAARPNIQVLPPVDDIDELLRRTRVLLVPSLWAEARSRIVLEAMLRGVPVMASNTGGIPEAKMGVPYLLPVRAIARYQTRLDEQMVPVAEVPPQDIGPWQEALSAMLTDRAHYEEIARSSRRAACEYARDLNVLPFERLLQETLSRPKKQSGAAENPARSTDTLSPERRKLLALRLRQKAGSAAWFPGAEGAQTFRLFCFPHAGGGASAFARWNEAVPERVTVCEVRLPGREARLAEAPFERMPPLVEALAQAIRPYLELPFAFYGHSMGAAVAFELARWLRRHDQPGPCSLFVAAARAPQFRRDWVPPPDPDDRQFLEELRRLEGIPCELSEHPELMRLVLPALRADAALYRRYVYTDEEPLACAIRAYGGESDPNVRPGHLEAWSTQTASSFGMQLLKGGHFFVQSGSFMQVLARDLEGLCSIPAK